VKCKGGHGVLKLVGTLAGYRCAAIPFLVFCLGCGGYVPIGVSARTPPMTPVGISVEHVIWSQVFTENDISRHRGGGPACVREVRVPAS
jgi:hypothetical protein